jgi:hypothetical protein
MINSVPWLQKGSLGADMPGVGGVDPNSSGGPPAKTD